ncbi:hypothetical protein AWL63_06205 [Sphingomonas panacis]|uniref:Uncharacterized protein n=2 Tax=Sphingomonas panacis TaxID=1560345 RepID=A0A1B3Z871_9SPHN|nr:hypothetical protein AWL63_06205 [Sphingomonas panacis]
MTFTDPSLPVLRDDAILSSGSLALVDFAHSANPLVGTPAAGVSAASIPNIAWKEAAALAGAGTQADWAFNSRVSLTAADGFIERSGKGGVHVCMSQVGGTGTGKGVTIERIVAAGSPLLQYLAANLTHKFYFSRWERITRVALTGALEPCEAAIYANSSGSPYSTGLLNLNRTGIVNAGLGSKSSPDLPQATGNSFRSGGFNGWTAAGQPNSTGAADIIAALMTVGQQPTAYNGASMANKSRSTILYRAYLEDLTASGRAYADVEALDFALFGQAFAAGGRYAGDTFTPVSTLP